METRELGSSDMKVAVLSLGTATFGGGTEFFKAWGTTDVAEATRLVDVALEAGVNMFDTADVYSNGLSEEILGKAIAGRRDKLLVSTKATFRTGPGPDDVGSSRKHLVAACEASLRRLGTDYIDVWSMHGFDALTPIDETLRAISDLVRDGKVRRVGCSNFSGWHLMKSLSIAERDGYPRYVAHQAYYGLLAREYEWELMPLAHDQGVGTVVWSPLSGGLLGGNISRDAGPLQGTRIATQGVRPGVTMEQTYDIIDVLREVAAESDRTVAQVALNWVLQRPTVASILIGARTETQLRENLGATQFMLSREQMQRLDRVSNREPTYPYWHQRQVFGERNPVIAG
ncbi:MAG: aldo/keto reductase [Gemmatimonadota bacterium]|nr:aldo/keto reductase [Gemmatimonadota bacterium]